MPNDRSPFSLTKFIVAIVFGMCLLAVSDVLGVNYAVDRAVSVDARTKAVKTHLTMTLPLMLGNALKSFGISCFWGGTFRVQR